MSTPDPYDLSERLYQAADAVRDGAPVPPELAAFLGELQGGGQLNPDGTPAATSVVQPEATPLPTPGAASSFAALLQQVPDVQRAIASGDDQTGHDAALALATAFNATADQHAREQSRERFPQAARSDEDLAKLNERVQAAYADPAGVDPADLDRLVESVNSTIDQLGAEREEQADAIERQRQAAQAARAAQHRREQPLVAQLEKLLAQARAGQPAGGRT